MTSLASLICRPPYQQLSTTRTSRPLSNSEVSKHTVYGSSSIYFYLIRLGDHTPSHSRSRRYQQPRCRQASPPLQTLLMD